MRALIPLLLLFSLLFAGSCSRTPDSAGNPETYSIGLVLPEGPQSNETVRQGLAIFLNHYNTELKHRLAEEFGTPAPNIAFRSVDRREPAALRDAPYEKIATYMADSLTREPNSVALIGNPSADYEYVDHDFYNANRIPLMALASSDPDVTRKSPWVFSMVYTDEWQGALMSAYVKEILGFASPGGSGGLHERA